MIKGFILQGDRLGVQFKERGFSAFENCQNEISASGDSEFPFTGILSTGCLAS